MAKSELRGQGGRDRTVPRSGATRPPGPPPTACSCSWRVRPARR